MAEVGSLEMVRGLYDYHWWGNRRLWDVAVTLGDEAATRDLGKHFSFPTLKAMFAHIYGADFVWMVRWKSATPPRLPADADFPTLAALRARWDEFEKEQRAFIEALTPADLGRVIEFKSVAYPRPNGEAYRMPLWPLLQHVPNHATHHRSEIATMLMLISGSPPGTDLALYYFRQQGFTG
jgi:uncharacterized damage-inducible protein DinB